MHAMTTPMEEGTIILNGNGLGLSEPIIAWMMRVVPQASLLWRSRAPYAGSHHSDAQPLHFLSTVTPQHSSALYTHPAEEPRSHSLPGPLTTS